MKQNLIFIADKQLVLTWLQDNCFGYKNAKTRENILPYIFFKKQFSNAEGKDRYFRAIVSQLKHERHVAATNDRGYWFVPLYTKDAQEIEEVLKSCKEMKSKAMDMLTDCDKNIKFWEDKKKVITQGQGEMAFA